MAVAPERFAETVARPAPPPVRGGQRHDPAQGGGARARDDRRRRRPRDRRGEHADVRAGRARSSADNTDAPGLLDALGAPAPGSALVLGAGGSARAVVYALRAAGAAVAVWNRTPARAERARRGARRGRASSGAAEAEVLVNCTSVGLHDPAATFKELPLNADDIGRYACVVDLVYRDGGTELLAGGRAPGLPVRRRSRDPGPAGRAELSDLDRARRAAGRDAPGRTLTPNPEQPPPPSRSPTRERRPPLSRRRRRRRRSPSRAGAQRPARASSPTSSSSWASPTASAPSPPSRRRARRRTRPRRSCSSWGAINHDQLARAIAERHGLDHLDLQRLPGRHGGREPRSTRRRPSATRRCRSAFADERTLSSRWPTRRTSSRSTTSR